MPKKNVAKEPVNNTSNLRCPRYIYGVIFIAAASLLPLILQPSNRQLLLSPISVYKNATYQYMPAGIMDALTKNFAVLATINDSDSPLKLPRFPAPRSHFENLDTPIDDTKNQTSNLQPIFDNVYWCGHGTLFGELDGDSFADVLFSDSRVIHRHRLVDPPLMSNRNITNGTNYSRDILLSTYGGDCMNNIIRMRDRSWKLPEVFSGQILYFNGEPKPGYPTDHPRVFSVGTRADSKKSIQIYFAAMYLNAMAMSTQLQIYDPKRKPVNTGKYFLIYAASNCIDYREEAFSRLASIGPVHYAGKCTGTDTVGNALTKHGNEPNISTNRTFRQPLENNTNGPAYLHNVELFHDYRFSLVLENAKMQGYISEKIVNAFLSGSIPIWYGTPDIKKVFNERAFIYYNITDPQKAIDRIRYLESNRTAYGEVMNAPILANAEDTIDQYFSIQDSIGSGLLKRRIREMVRVP